MKQVIIYPGRFQPMLSHHAEVYKQLQAEFPEADVYIGTSDKVEGDKSPFNFKEKQLIAQAHGIDPSKVLLAKRPYHKDEYPFDENNTVIIFAVGEKDLDRFPFSNVDPETGLDMTVRGEPKPKYYQKINTYRTDPQPMSERGYITLAPTVKTGDEVASASAFRDSLRNAPDKDSAKEIYTKQFGNFDPKVFELIFNKVKGNEMSEQLNILRKLAGLESISEAPVQMPDFDKGERPKTAKERDAYRAWKKSQAAAAKGDDESPLAISPKDKRDAEARPEKAAKSNPTAVGFTKIKPEDMIDKKTGNPIPSKQRQKSVANQFPADADLSDPSVKKEVFMKFTAKRPDLMFGEINARLANDDNGLAVSDRLSGIVRELEDTRNVMELDPEDKKFALKLLQNAIDNMELVRATDIDKAIDVEPMQLDVDDDEPELGDDEMAPVLDTDDEPMRDSINFDDIRAEYGVEEGRRGKQALMPGGKVYIGRGEVAHHDDYGWMARGIDEDDFQYFDSEDEALDYVANYRVAKPNAMDDWEEDERRRKHFDAEPRVSAPRFKDDEVHESNFPEGTHPCEECDGSGCNHCNDKGFHYDDESVEEAVEEAVENTTTNAMTAALAELRKLAGV